MAQSDLEAQVLSRGICFGVSSPAVAVACRHLEPLSTTGTSFSRETLMLWLGWYKKQNPHLAPPAPPQKEV